MALSPLPGSHQLPLTLHLPRKGMETTLHTDLKNDQSTILVDITSSPQGDGNILMQCGTSGLSLLLTLHLPRKGMETRNSLKKPLASSTVDITSSPQGDGNFQLSQPLMRSPCVDITSSPQGDGNFWDCISFKEILSFCWLTLHLPRKGMETAISLCFQSSKQKLTLHLPRKGMETYCNHPKLV